MSRANARYSFLTFLVCIPNGSPCVIGLRAHKGFGSPPTAPAAPEGRRLGTGCLRGNWHGARSSQVSGPPHGWAERAIVNGVRQCALDCGRELDRGGLRRACDGLRLGRQGRSGQNRNAKGRSGQEGSLSRSHVRSPPNVVKIGAASQRPDSAVQKPLQSVMGTRMDIRWRGSKGHRNFLEMQKYLQKI